MDHTTQATGSGTAEQLLLMMKVIRQETPLEIAAAREVIHAHTGRLSALAGMLGTVFVNDQIEVVVSCTASAPLASHLAYYLSITSLDDVLCIQAHENERGQFTFSPHGQSYLLGRTILVVDDIVTSNSQTGQLASAANIYGRVIGIGTLINRGVSHPLFEQRLFALAQD